jgi:hypothetical protein
LEIQRHERWVIKWNAIRDRVRYRRVPIGQATSWSWNLNARYAGISLTLRQQLEERGDALEKEQAMLRAQLAEPPVVPHDSQARPTGTARQRHDWALERRADRSSAAAARAGTTARQSATIRLAAVQIELDQLEGKFKTLDGLCESAYLVRVEMYNRTRCSRADRKVTDVASGPPYEGPGWRPGRPHLASVQTRSA